jgi:hypothetical protein
MRPFALKLASLAIGVTIALALSEGAAIAWLGLRDGRYTPAPELFARGTNTFVRETANKLGCRYADTLFPHPYLASVHHANPPCGIPYLNNIGLFGTDYPATRRSDRYTILLTGGSVAAQMGQMLGPPAPRYLEEALNARYISPTGKPFLVLNGGDGAWKQPQQMILFSLFADRVDAVVTLDGYNEQHLFRPGTTARFELPGNNVIDANPIVAQDSFGTVVASWLAGRVSGWMEQSVLVHSHAAYLVSEALSRATTNPENVGANTYWRMMVLPSEIYDDAGRLYAWQLAQWRKYIRIMDLTAKSYGVKSMYFLQPVPAVGKALTEEERRSTPDAAYGERYHRIVRDLEALNESGIAVRDLLDVFAGEPGTIYADWIHAVQEAGGESRGYRLMADRMARDMAEGWGLRPKP